MANEKGASLVELLLVVIVLGSIVMLMANLPSALSLATKSKHLSLAREIAIKQLEDKKAIKYTNLVNDNNPILDPRLSLIPHATGSVEVKDCDPTICKASEPIKQISTKIYWIDNGKEQTVVLDAMIGEGGLNQ